jgi:hypothetical protein
MGPGSGPPPAWVPACAKPHGLACGGSTDGLNRGTAWPAIEAGNRLRGCPKDAGVGARNSAEWVPEGRWRGCPELARRNLEIDARRPPNLSHPNG